MQAKLGSDVMVCGACPKDADFKTVGDKQSSLCKFSLKVGERKVEGEEKPVAIWCNCTAWHGVAKASKGIKKGDVVFCIGKIKTSEYEGKERKDLECEFVSVMGKTFDGMSEITKNASQAGIPINKSEEDFIDIPDDGSDLPF
jgi:single-stranded DNA-binding protein